MVLEIVAVVIGLVGVAGTLLPFIPGVILIYAGMVLAAIGSGFEVFGTKALVGFLLVTAAAELSDYILGALGAKWSGASRWGVIGAIAGGIVGLIVLGPIGILAGPLLGALLGELVSGKRTEVAIKAAVGATAGALTGTLFRFSIGVAMYAYLIVRIVAQHKSDVPWWI